MTDHAWFWPVVLLVLVIVVGTGGIVVRTRELDRQSAARRTYVQTVKIVENLPHARHLDDSTAWVLWDCPECRPGIEHMARALMRDPEFVAWVKNGSR